MKVAIRIDNEDKRTIEEYIKDLDSTCNPVSAANEMDFKKEGVTEWVCLDCGELFFWILPKQGKKTKPSQCLNCGSEDIRSTIVERKYLMIFIIGGKKWLRKKIEGKDMERSISKERGGCKSCDRTDVRKKWKAKMTY